MKPASEQENRELDKKINERIESRTYSQSTIELPFDFSGLNLDDPNKVVKQLFLMQFGVESLGQAKVVLDFSNNKISAWNWDLDEGDYPIGYQDHIWALNFANNLISSFPSNTPDFFNNIGSLNLSNNQLETLPSSILRLTKLQYFNISGNRFTKLSDRIGELKELTYLDISNNNISELPSSLTDLSGLEVLNIERTNISSLPREINKLLGLTTLKAANSKLSIFPIYIHKLINLKLLDLRNTQLTLPPEILEKVESPVEIINYYDNLREKKRPLGEAKIVVIGQGSAECVNDLRHEISEFSHSWQ
jgi:hypothetical protein